VVDTKMMKSAGEHWVASMLARHGWAPALTRDGLERTDVLAVKTTGDKRQMIEVQVKTTTATSWPLGDLSGKLAKSSREWYALVRVPENPKESPRTFVVPRDHVAASTWIEHQAWLVQPGVPTGQRNAGHNRARSNLISYLDYEDRWDLRRRRCPTRVLTHSTPWTDARHQQHAPAPCHETARQYLAPTPNARCNPAPRVATPCR
jgi:hypothetical protein